MSHLLFLAFLMFDSNGKSWNMGQANSTLEYYDGVLKLLYENGDRYHTDPVQYRKVGSNFLYF